MWFLWSKIKRTERSLSLKSPWGRRENGGRTGKMSSKKVEISLLFPELFQLGKNKSVHAHCFFSFFQIRYVWNFIFSQVSWFLLFSCGCSELISCGEIEIYKVIFLVLFKALSWEFIFKILLLGYRTLKAPQIWRKDKNFIATSHKLYNLSCWVSGLFSELVLSTLSFL